MRAAQNVLIVGARIAGMSLGVALRRAGIDCEIALPEDRRVVAGERAEVNKSRIELLANLDQVSPTGALIIASWPKEGLGLSSGHLCYQTRYTDLETEETPRWPRQPPTHMSLIWTSSSIR